MRRTRPDLRRLTPDVRNHTHEIGRPDMDPENAERVGRAMLTAGIPESAMASVLEELAGEN